MDVLTEDTRFYHQRAHSDPHILQDLNLFQLDEEGGGFPSLVVTTGRRDEAHSLLTKAGSGRHDDCSGFPPQMGSGRRDARVVCETFSSGSSLSTALSPKMRQSGSQKGSTANVRRRSLAYSRNPLLACFFGESVLSSRAIHLSSNCDASTGSQKTFFSLIPVDRSRVNEKTGEPQSPQLSCIGQVKHRQVKMAKAAEMVTEDLVRMDINDGIIPHSMDISKTDPAAKCQKRESFKLHKGESFKLQKQESFRLQFEESFKLRNVETFQLRKEESFKAQKEESFKRQKEESVRLQKEVSFKLQKKQVPLALPIDDIPHLDLAGRTTLDDDFSYFEASCGKNSARLMRCKRVAEDEKKLDDDDQVNSPSQKHSIRYLNHFLKQKLGASMVKGGFVCGWSSGEASPRSPKSERSETESELCEIDLSRFASGDFPPKTPSFRDTKYCPRTGKKLPDVRVHVHQLPQCTTDRRSWKDEAQGKVQNDASLNSVTENSIPSSKIVIKCPPSAVILQPATEAALWKRRCMPRPLSLEIST